MRSNLNNDNKFQTRIDHWVLNQIKNGVPDFNSLILSLPSIYPTLVIDSLKRLLKNGLLNKTLFDKFIKDSKKKISSTNKQEIRNILFPPHPLDFDWRFTQDTAKELVSTCISLTESEDTIVFLGTPSLFNKIVNQKIDRNFILIDTNVSDFNNINPNCSKYFFDLFEGVPKHLHSIAKLVIMDPPWYPDYQRAFLNNASMICKTDGIILMVAPRAGTRPNVKREWRDLVSWVKKIGLVNEGLLDLNVAYDTPYFEKNALKKGGITNFPLDWRRADLSVFKKQINSDFFFSKRRYSSDWYKESYMGIRIRQRPYTKTFRDPSLRSIISGNILPTVSRRDEHRKTADVWTYGNRIFQCEGTNILHYIICCLKDGYSPNKTIESLLKRELTYDENKLIKKTIIQINKLTNLEKKEISEGVI